MEDHLDRLLIVSLINIKRLIKFSSTYFISFRAWNRTKGDFRGREREAGVTSVQKLHGSVSRPRVSAVAAIRQRGMSREGSRVVSQLPPRDHNPFALFIVLEGFGRMRVANTTEAFFLLLPTSFVLFHFPDISVRLLLARKPSFFPSSLDSCTPYLFAPSFLEIPRLGRRLFFRFFGLFVSFFSTTGSLLCLLKPFFGFITSTLAGLFWKINEKSSMKGLQKHSIKFKFYFDSCQIIM